MIGKSPKLPGRAETPLVPLVEEQKQEPKEETELILALKEYLDSQSEEINALKSRVKEKFESIEDKEALKDLVSDQLSIIQGKHVMTKMSIECGESFLEVRKIFETILRENPIPFDALFQNALLMDQIGEVETVINKLEETLLYYETEINDKAEDRDIRFVFAQYQFLKKNIEEALEIYQELAIEDPNDYRSYFCQLVIYTLLDRNEEAKKQFEMGRKLSPKVFDQVEGFLQNLPIE